MQNAIHTSSRFSVKKPMAALIADRRKLVSRNEVFSTRIKPVGVSMKEGYRFTYFVLERRGYFRINTSTSSINVIYTEAECKRPNIYQLILAITDPDSQKVEDAQVVFEVIGTKGECRQKRSPAKAGGYLIDVHGEFLGRILIEIEVVTGAQLLTDEFEIEGT